MANVKGTRSATAWCARSSARASRWGRGGWTPRHRDIREEAERVHELKVLAARGLTLTEVGYPDDQLLGARAEQTRARRDRE